MEELKAMCAIGWGLAIISPFVWRMVYNWYDEKHKDDTIHISTEGYVGMFGTCQNCKQSVPKFTTTVSPTKFCPHCGQALEWDE